MPPSWSTTGSPCHALLERHDLRLGARAEVVVVRDEEVSVGGRGRTGHEVAAAALGLRRARLVPDLLHRAGEELEPVDARGFGAPVELLDQPGQPGLRERAVLGGERELIGLRAAGGQVVPGAVRRRHGSLRGRPRPSGGRPRGGCLRRGSAEGSAGASRRDGSGPRGASTAPSPAMVVPAAGGRPDLERAAERVERVPRGSAGRRRAARSKDRSRSRRRRRRTRAGRRRSGARRRCGSPRRTSTRSGAPRGSRSRPPSRSRAGSDRCRRRRRRSPTGRAAPRAARAPRRARGRRAPAGRSRASARGARRAPAAPRSGPRRASRPRAPGRAAGAPSRGRPSR